MLASALKGSWVVGSEVLSSAVPEPNPSRHLGE
jgi:hypothetical protein